MRNKIVSIITPVYIDNDSKVEKLLDLELELDKQESFEFEWVRVFDGCDVVESHAKNFKVKDVQLKNNYGPSVARNVGFFVSAGTIIAFIDSDDLPYSNFITNILKNFSSNIGLKLLFSAYEIFDTSAGIKSGEHNLNKLLDITKVDFKLRDEVLLLGLSQNINLSTPLGVAVDRQLLYLCGGFQPGIVCGEDGITWRRILQTMNGTKILNEGSVKISDDIVGTYFVNENSQSRTQRRFEMGGFAFDGSDIQGKNGQYLDNDWFTTLLTEKYDD